MRWTRALRGRREVGRPAVTAVRSGAGAGVQKSVTALSISDHVRSHCSSGRSEVSRAPSCSSNAVRLAIRACTCDRRAAMSSTTACSCRADIVAGVAESPGIGGMPGIAGSPAARYRSRRLPGARRRTGCRAAVGVAPDRTGCRSCRARPAPASRAEPPLSIRSAISRICCASWVIDRAAAPAGSGRGASSSAMRTSRVVVPCPACRAARPVSSLPVRLRWRDAATGR